VSGGVERDALAARYRNRWFSAAALAVHAPSRHTVSEFFRPRHPVRAAA